MIRNDSFRSLLTARVVGWAVWVTLGASSSGCLAFVVGAAGGVAGAVYVPGRLTEERSFDVPVVYGAALTAMQELELKL